MRRRRRSRAHLVQRDPPRRTHAAALRAHRSAAAARRLAGGARRLPRATSDFIAAARRRHRHSARRRRRARARHHQRRSTTSRRRWRSQSCATRSTGSAGIFIAEPLDRNPLRFAPFIPVGAAGAPRQSAAGRARSPHQGALDLRQPHHDRRVAVGRPGRTMRVYSRDELEAMVAPLGDRFELDLGPPPLLARRPRLLLLRRAAPLIRPATSLRERRAGIEQAAEVGDEPRRARRAARSRAEPVPLDELHDRRVLHRHVRDGALARAAARSRSAARACRSRCASTAARRRDVIEVAAAFVVGDEHERVGRVVRLRAPRRSRACTKRTPSLMVVRRPGCSVLIAEPLTNATCGSARASRSAGELAVVAHARRVVGEPRVVVGRDVAGIEDARIDRQAGAAVVGRVGAARHLSAASSIDW